MKFMLKQANQSWRPLIHSAGTFLNLRRADDETQPSLAVIPILSTLSRIYLLKAVSVNIRPARLERRFSEREASPRSPGNTGNSGYMRVAGRLS